jgi:hypothetical protein
MYPMNGPFSLLPDFCLSLSGESPESAFSQILDVSSLPNRGVEEKGVLRGSAYSADT